MPVDQHRLISYAVVGALFIVVLALRMRRMMQHRPFNVRFVWVLPAILLAIAVFAFTAHPPSAQGWVWAIAAFMIGAALGWLRARTVTLSLDPETRQVMARGTPLAILFLAVLFVIRFGLRSLLQSESAYLGVSASLIDDAFLVMAVGLFLARAVEMGLRAKALLDGAATA